MKKVKNIFIALLGAKVFNFYLPWNPNLVGHTGAIFLNIVLIGLIWFCLERIDLLFNAVVFDYKAWAYKVMFQRNKSRRQRVERKVQEERRRELRSWVEQVTLAR